MTDRARRTLCWIALALAGLALGGCDKCGNRVPINVPAIPKSCA